jgi:hypothetical protein
MHIRKYDPLYTRRQCLESLGKGVVSAGILMPLFDAWAKTGDIAAAYPDEALQIETYSKGAVKTGGQLDAGNVDSVKDLLDPVTYMEIKEQGRICRIAPTVTDMNKLAPIPYNEATERNAGKAQFDAKGNVVVEGGKPWIGGNPFPNADTAQKVIAAHAVSWGRNDQTTAPTRMEIVDADGNMQFTYEFLWVDYATVARTVLDPKPYVPGQEDKLRYVTFLTTYPTDAAGAASLNVWSYDQTKFPQLFVYAPSLKRIRRFPANQRFEPIMSGTSMMPTTMWMVGDPYMTWGNFKLVGKAPFLLGASDNWNVSDPNWAQQRVGGKSGRKFYLTTLELVPEAYVVELEPVGYANAPISKKRIWFDARTMNPMMMIVYDKEGRPWQGYSSTCSLYSANGQTISNRHPLPSKDPYWSWCAVQLHDLKTGHVTQAAQVKQISGGYTLKVNDPGAYQQFCTVESLQQLGG